MADGHLTGWDGKDKPCSVMGNRLTTEWLWAELIRQREASSDRNEPVPRGTPEGSWRKERGSHKGIILPPSPALLCISTGTLEKGKEL